MGAQPGTQAAAGETSDAISLDMAVSAFQALTGIEGRVFLVGEIVERGETDDEIEVALTEGSDRTRIADSLTDFAPRMLFKSVEGEPQERYVEVTPGATAAPQGEEMPLDFLEA